MIPWLDTEFVLGQFSTNKLKAQRMFNKFVAEKTGEGHREEFHGKASPDSRIIGDDSFVDEILRQEETRPCRKPDMDAILTGVKRLYGLTDEDITAPGQKRLPSEARMMAAWAVREFSNSTLAELAQKVGRDASAMSAAAARFDIRRKREKDLTAKTERLQKELEVSFFQA
jgi:chromosomal replication initiation ATPase DnaA